MCVGIPVQLIARDGIRGEVLENGQPGLIDLSLTPDARAGDWLLAFLGTAREIIDADQAQKIAAALDGLRAVMAGGDLGSAFADLEAREPQLPAHLQAALAAGRSHG